MGVCYITYVVFVVQNSFDLCELSVFAMMQIMEG